MNIISREKETIRFKRHEIDLLEVIKETLENDFGEPEDEDNNFINLEISTETLLLIRGFCRLSNTFEDNELILIYYVEQIEDKKIFDLCKAADFLNIQKLLDITIEVISERLRNEFKNNVSYLTRKYRYARKPYFIRN